MSLIKNLISEPENKPRRKKNGKDDQEDEEEEKPRPIIKSVTDLQRLKLEKLMKNPDKPVIIPEAPKEKDYMQTVPSFVRNVMGSSAGAGSGEFHVYRHLRRKEYARQKTIQAKSIREQLDEEYQKKLEENRRKAEEKTAKKRAKRLKKKQRSKKPKVEKNNTASNVVDDKDEETSDDDEGEIAQDDNTVQTNEENVDSSGNESATSAENANGTQEQNIGNNSNTNPVQDTTAETNTESREELPKDDIGAQETTSTSQNAEVIETNESTRTN